MAGCCANCSKLNFDGKSSRMCLKTNCVLEILFNSLINIEFGSELDGPVKISFFVVVVRL